MYVLEAGCLDSWWDRGVWATRPSKQRFLRTSNRGLFDLSVASRFCGYFLCNKYNNREQFANVSVTHYSRWLAHVTSVLLIYALQSHILMYVIVALPPLMAYDARHVTKVQQWSCYSWYHSCNVRHWCYHRQQSFTQESFSLSVWSAANLSWASRCFVWRKGFFVEQQPLNSCWCKTRLTVDTDTCLPAARNSLQTLVFCLSLDQHDKFSVSSRW